MRKKSKKAKSSRPINLLDRLIKSLHSEFSSIWTQSKQQISHDVHTLWVYLFEKKKRQIRLIKREQVIYGNWLTSLETYKKYKALKQKIRRVATELRISIKIAIDTFIYFVKAILLRMKYFTIGALTIAFFIFLYQTDTFVKNLPNPKMLLTRDVAATTKIYDRNRILLYEIYQEENRTPIKLSQIPSFVKQATIAIEDKDFYLHQGISPAGVIRAILHNVQSDNLEGGSTITQQLVRSAFLTPKKTLQRKLIEMVLAYWTETIYTKDQILEMYLNQVPYGGTAWGIEAAAQTYFGKSVADLTLAQAALLAGLPAAPSRYSPFGLHPELGRLRQAQVLDRMAQLGFIKKEDVNDLKNEPLALRTPRVPIAAPHFVMYVKELLDTYLGDRTVATGGLRVITSLDLPLQEKAQKIVTQEVEKLKPLNVSNGASLITDPKTGEIRAMVGSVDYFDRDAYGAVNVTTSLRQPGSSIKVVTYAASLSNGFTAQSLLDDTPVVYRDGYRSYAPVNYDGRFHGRVPLRVALGSSYNVPAVKVLATIGLDTMIETAKKMGITTWNDSRQYGLSLTLGAGEVTMIDMAQVYGTLANNGTRISLTPFIQLINYKGEQILNPFPSKSRDAIPKEVALSLSDILTDNDARTPAFGAHSALLIPEKRVSVKTGTSDSKRDNWTIGYTPDYVVAVWVGNNDNSPMHPTLTSGVTGAAPIWNALMTLVLSQKS